ncbi:MAG: LytTR family transcriptional regulator DNA-binding domain-containing protein [Clostridia bacterium]|nr:LytTR family transcriptional regulator DNA-binding domain-containing protein [Clostridia bacterium]
MIRIGIYEENPQARKAVRDFLGYYAFNRNTEMDFIWFTDDAAAESVLKYASGLEIAFVSIQAKHFKDFVLSLNRGNHNCRICCYQMQPAGTPNVSNPIWIMSEQLSAAELAQHHDILSQRVDSMLSTFQSMGNFLAIDTRRLLYLLARENILYLNSDLKYVNIVMRDGEIISVYKKLDEFESQKLFRFVRVHKSYIVNAMYVKEVDKSNRQIEMRNGEMIPISNAHYKEAVQQLAEVF